jgi:hypothetical protein
VLGVITDNPSDLESVDGIGAKRREPGVIDLGGPELMHKRRYRNLRIINYAPVSMDVHSFHVRTVQA